MRKIKAIWKLIWCDRFMVYTSNCFGTGTASYDCDIVDWRIIQAMSDQQIEVDESVEYVKSLLTEI